MNDQKLNQEETVSRGFKGEVGQASPGQTIRQLWHQAHFTHVDVANSNKKVWMANPGAPSLKRFAFGLLKTNPIAQQWLDNKKGAANQERSPLNVKAAIEAALATKTEKRKKSANKAAKKK